MAKEKKGLLYNSIEYRNNNLRKNLGGKYSEYHELLVPAIGEAYDVYAREKKVAELTTGDTLNSLYYERLQTRLNNDVKDVSMVTNGQDVINHEIIPVYSKLGQISRQFEYLTLNKKALDNDAREISKKHITPYLPEALGLYSNNIYNFNDKWESRDENGRNNYLDSMFDDMFIMTITPEDAQNMGLTYYFDQIQRSYEPSYNGAEWLPYNATDAYIVDLSEAKSIERRYIYPSSTLKYTDGINFYTAKTPYYKTVYNEVSDRFPINYTKSIDKNHTLTGEIIQIDNYQVKSRDLIGKTNYLYSQNKIDSLINRFHTTNFDGDNKSIIQTAVSPYGLSRGRNLLKKDPTRENSYENPYCRVWTSHYQYSKYSDTIRPFNENGSTMTFEGYASKIPGRLRPHKAGKRLDSYSSLDTSTNRPIIAPARDDKEDTKRYMFSLENLAWKGNTEALSKEQLGPNGGRIMWFPPYDIKFSENVGVSWNANQFIGRAENVYTYANTERSGTLSFKILVDHPSMLDEMSRREIDATDPAMEEEILRFFAGCDVPNYYVESYDNLNEDPGIETVEENGEEKGSADSQDATPEYEQIKIVYYTFFPNNYSGIDYFKSTGKNKERTYDEKDILTGNDAPIAIGLEMMEYLIGKGATIEQAAGIIGNWHQESRLDPATKPGDGGHSWGLGQWNDSPKVMRAENLIKYYNKKHGTNYGTGTTDNMSVIQTFSWKDQIDFACDSKKSGGEAILSYVTKNDTAESAASKIAMNYERCAACGEGQDDNTHRKALAKSYYAYYLKEKGDTTATLSQPDPMLYLLAGYGVNKKYEGKSFDEYTKEYDSNPGYESTTTGVSVDDASEIIDGKWKYLVDEQQRKEVLKTTLNYWDTISNGLNCDYVSVSKTDDITTKIIKVKDNLYTLGEVYAALDSISVDNPSQIMDRVLANGGRKEKIEWLIKIFSDMKNECESIDVTTCGFASTHDTSNDNSTQNKALYDGRGEVAREWVVKKLTEKNPGIKIDGEVLAGQICTELNDNQHDVNTYNAKLARSARTVITLSRKKSDNIVETNKEVNASTADDIIASTLQEIYMQEYDAIKKHITLELSKTFYDEEVIFNIDYNNKNNSYRNVLYFSMRELESSLALATEELYEEYLRLALAKKKLEILEEKEALLKQEILNLSTQTGKESELAEKGKELDEVMASRNNILLDINAISENLNHLYASNFPTDGGANQSQVESGSTEIGGNLERKDKEQGKVGEAVNIAGKAIYEKTTNSPYKREYGANVDNEAAYFKRIQNDDPLIYRAITEKIKHFDPAFHSISPEGFNARLTFLHQCTRQGPTTAVYSNMAENADGRSYSVTKNNERGMYPSNLAFGRAPYCILRIGDFYNTKILIDSLSIDYDQQQWDLNPEGIGIQPMIANIQISFKFIGGSDIAGPIERLQNAVSFNYYANASVYDRRADYFAVAKTADDKCEDTVILGDTYSNNDLKKKK